MHKLDLFKTADRIIDLGPEGGNPAAQGTLGAVAGTKGSHMAAPGRDREAGARHAESTAGARVQAAA